MQHNSTISKLNRLRRRDRRHAASDGIGKRSGERMLDPVDLLHANRALAARASAARDGAETTPTPVFTEIKMVELAGQTLRVGIRRAGGDAPPLVVFNGIGANLELLEPFVSALEGVEIVAFD